MPTLILDQQHELDKAERWLRLAEPEMSDYHNKTDLIGRALRYIRDHALKVLLETRHRFALNK
jgi:hypothetical protein